MEQTSNLLHPEALENWQKFAKILEQSVNAQLPSSARAYAKVKVLILHWIQDDFSVSCEDECIRFKKFLTSKFGYSCSLFAIPYQAQAALKTNMAVIQWATSIDENDLGILHYSGHGKSDALDRSIWVPFNKDSKHDVRWSRIQPSLGDIQGDVLVLLDCCYAATVGPGEAQEVLAATGIKETVQGPGEQSFTSSIMRAMEDFGNQPSNAAMLHAMLCEKAYRHKTGTTPIHIARKDSARPSIFLPNFSQPVNTEASEHPDEKVKVLVKFTLQSGSEIPDVQQWITNLSTNMPPNIASGDISLEGVFDSGSTTGLLTMPVRIWTCLGKNPALELVGYVEGHNKMLEQSVVKHLWRLQKRSDESNTTMDTSSTMASSVSPERSSNFWK